MIPSPKPDELVELLFSEVIEPPDGYEYYPTKTGEQLLYPMYGSDDWRILLQKKGAKDWNPHAVVITGEFIRKVSKALHALQEAVNKTVSDDIPEPTNARVS